MKVSSIYGKRVLGTAGKEGYAVSVYAEGNRLACIVCADENEKEFAISADSIKSFKDKIIFKEGGSVKKSGTPVTLGKYVYDCDGVCVGKLTDITVEKNELVFAHVGNKKFPYGDIAVGDAVIIKSSARVLKSDVKKDGRVLIRRGTPVTPEILKKAQEKGEYVQTNLKTMI